MIRRIHALLVVLAFCRGTGAAEEKTAAHYVPADAWLVIAYDGAHPGFRDTPLHRFVQEPEVQDALKLLQPLVDEVLAEGKEEMGLDLAPVLRAALGCDMALAFLPPPPGKDEPVGVLVAHVGVGEAPARQQAEALMKAALATWAKPDSIRRVPIGQLQATRYVDNTRNESHTYVFDGAFFVLTVDEEVLKRVLDPATPKLAEKAPGERAALSIRYDHLAMLKAVGNQIEPEVRRVLDAVGLNALSAAEMAFVPREKRLVTSLVVEMPEGAVRRGLLKGLADAAPYDPELLKLVPRDASYFWLAAIDFGWVWDEVLATVGRVDVAAANTLRQEVAAVEQKVGLKVREGLLAPLGRGTLAVGKTEGIIGGWSAVVQRVRDPEALEKALAQVVARLDIVLMGMDLGAVRTDLKTFQYRGHTCRYLWMMGAPAVALPFWSLCYTRMGDTFVFAPNVLQLKGFLDSVEDKGPTILANEEFRGLLAAVPKGATSLGYANWGDPIQAVYNTIAPILAVLQGVPDFAGKLDLANLPSSRLVRRYTKGTIGYTVFENGRFRLEAQGDGLDVLGPHLVTLGGVFLGGAFWAGFAQGAAVEVDVGPAVLDEPIVPPPALDPVRVEALRIRDRNNLVQIAKACADYLHVFGDNRFYPKSLVELLDKKLIKKDVLVSPLDPDPPKLPNGVPCSYVSCFDKYPNRVFRDDFPPNVMMAWCRKAFAPGKRSLLYFDSHVEVKDDAGFDQELKTLDDLVKKRTTERQPGKEGEPKPGPAKGEF
ncbi:MAG TPA: hypothetical protein VNE39_00130 [Planctomycetota bacterium]|nr:hypothetical protein [Planctomycetota bacterium]